MNKEKMKNKDVFFENSPEHFEKYQGKLISASEIKQTDFEENWMKII